ncbi:polysaccharide pyruvyl transferase family protein [Ruminococcus sp.]|uniref:polysaccharide pyruvyl transferase family protein n=1 Tax=Ruminococcus sp. TaxID=41978 RepID=UPI0025E11C12|nr:polysaccharide pyruvyl transferase family protein [Ruminococcus sp.]
MKIAVITMHAVKNYGSALQTYATQRILESLGCEPVVIDYIREKNLDKNLISTWTRKDTGIKKLLKAVVLYPTVLRWKKVFNSYLHDNIRLTDHCYSSEQDLLSSPVEADVFCTGSDQVWNSGWNDGIERAFYLTFVPDNVPKIAFAASIGKAELTQEETDAVKPLLERYNAISVREESAQRLLLDLGLHNVEFCLDPTLLLSRSEWLKHAKRTLRKKKYILVYQLDHDTSFDCYAQEVAHRTGLELVRICTRFDQVRLPGKPVFIPEVCQFISLINQAECVITNSFHATAFCINLNTNFISIYPSEYSSRLHDVLTLFDLQERHLSSWKQFDLIDRPIDFARVNTKLREERKTSIELIKKMIASCAK